MTLWAALSFALAMLILAATPGPGVFITSARALDAGFGAAAVVVAGIVAGDLIFLLLAIFGLGALAELLGDLFRFVQYAGAAYLIWLGISIWRKASATAAQEAAARPSAVRVHGALSGLVITLANPKVILFYLGFLPTFMDLQELTAGDIGIVATIVTVVLGGTLLVYAYAAARAAQAIRRPRTTRIMHRTSGGLMVAVGTALALRS